MRAGPVALWTALAALGALDVVLCRVTGIGFTHWLPFLAVSAAIAGVGALYAITGRSAQIAGMANGTLLWMVASLLGAILTYAAAARGEPLHDSALAAADAALGFDWTAWYGFVSGHLLLRLPLALAYTSLLPQILLSVIWFSYRGWAYRNYELLTAFIIGILITAAVFHLYPALGPCVDVAAFRAAYIDELIGLHAGAVRSVDIMHLKGVVAFPSFHTVLAGLFVYAHRRSPLFLPVALLNAVMVAAIPSEGGHYLVDMFAGGAIAGAAILATRGLARLPHRSLGQFLPRRLPAPFRAGGEIS